MNNKKFLIIGGDVRNFYVANSLFASGHEVKAFGFENLSIKDDTSFLSNDFLKTAKECDYIILPTIPSTDNKTLNMPFSTKKIEFDDNFVDILKDKKIFCGLKIVLTKINEKFLDLSLFDYSEREDFAIFNAIPTAEGTLKIAIEEHNKTINLSKCLISGYGRIGKVLTKLLKNMGAEVTVASKCSKELAWAEALNNKIIDLKNIDKKTQRELDFDIIFNTIPAMIFNKSVLTKLSEKTLIIDVASQPGGIDFEEAKKFGIKAIHALALPGKYSPKTAGEIITKTIFNIIEENKL